jgi:hypothetical protein
MLNKEHVLTPVSELLHGDILFMGGFEAYVVFECLEPDGLSFTGHPLGVPVGSSSVFSLLLVDGARADYSRGETLNINRKVPVILRLKALREGSLT